MGVEIWIAILAALFGGGGIVGLVGSLILLPKLKAEARKLNTESDGMVVTRLYAEIDRLDRELGSVRTELASVKSASAERETELEKENKALRSKVARLEQRIQAMEKVLADVFKTAPNTPEFNDLLRRIDEAEAELKRERRR